VVSRLCYSRCAAPAIRFGSSAFAITGFLSASSAGRGVLVKAPKRDQDLRYDLPTVGQRTVEGVSKAQLAGLAVIAGNTLAADTQAMIEAADKCGVFIQGVGE